MNSLILNILLWLFSVFVSSVSQTLLKISANKEYPDRLHEYLNPYVIIAYGMFFASTFMTMFAMRVVPYSFSPMLESTSYIFIPLFGVLILKEKIRRRRILGICIILIGMLIFALAKIYGI